MIASARTVARTIRSTTVAVLFQQAGTGSIDALSLDEAVTATAAGRGWIRAYCD